MVCVRFPADRKGVKIDERHVQERHAFEMQIVDKSINVHFRDEAVWAL